MNGPISKVPAGIHEKKTNIVINVEEKVLYEERQALHRGTYIVYIIKNDNTLQL